MSLNKKVLAVAIVGGLFAGAAQAAVNITPGGEASVPVKIASEVILNSTTGTTFANASNALDLQVATGYAFSTNEVRYARVECSDNMAFVMSPDHVPTVPGGLVGAVNGNGTNAIHFSITATADAGIANNAVLTIPGNRAFDAAAPVSCEYSLYDEPSQAAAGGTAGRIAAASDAYATFASSYLADINPLVAVAAVEADPSYSRFIDGDAVNGTVAALAEVKFDTRDQFPNQGAQPIATDGQAITLEELLADTSAFLVKGDFSFAVGANGRADVNRVFLAVNGTCEDPTDTLNATAVTSTTATFRTGDNDLTHGLLCYSPNNGRAAIPMSDYTAEFIAVSQDPTTYSVGSLGPVDAGSITRDGTQLQAPLAQRPNGWTSRMVLTNTGGLDRAYTISVQGEAGNTIGTDNLTGTVPANGTVVVDLNDVLKSFTGSARATLNVSVAGPNEQIQGLYQIVNAASGSISNHVMVRPGSN